MRRKARNMEHPDLLAAQSPACKGSKSLLPHRQSNYLRRRWLVYELSGPKLMALCPHLSLRLQLDTRSRPDPKRSHWVTSQY